MASYSSSPFDQVLTNVQASRAWLEQLGVRTSETRLELIEQTLSTFLADLKTRSAADVVAEWDWSARQDAYYALVDGAAFSRIHLQLGQLKSNVLRRDELRRALQGPLVPSSETPSTTDPRNVFMELDLAATLKRGGVEITGFDDVRFRFDSTDYVTQCKRPFRSNSVAANVKRAWEQIDDRAPKGSHLRGIIALAVDKVLGLDQQRPPTINNEKELATLVRSYATRFIQDHHSAWEGVDQGGCRSTIGGDRTGF